MFVSVAAGAWGKGGDLLLTALQQLPESVRANSMLLILGSGGQDLAEACGIPSKQMGYIHDDARKAAIYAAADVLVTPSRAENQPLVLIEAMACGVPMVGFDVGGIGELVQTGRTGYLAKRDDPADLAAGISYVLDDAQRHQAMADTCRSIAINDHDVAGHARRYIELFEELVRQRRSHA
jgi:glycosyltransferase involved in cell wall biosynthesis